MQGTDNSLLEYKVALRCAHLPTGPVSVLDCFGGYGVVWKEVGKRSRRDDIIRHGIDMEHRPGLVRGDNRKWLQGLTLDRYNVIDLDAYGVPFDQVDVLFKRGYRGTVFFTMIQTMMGIMPARLLNASGIEKTARKLCPTLFGQIGWMLWLDWLANNGVEKVFHCSKDRKHYGCFLLT